MVTLADVKAAQPDWFSRANKKFFGDIDYRILHGKKSKNPFLVRATYKWTNMFGGRKTKTYIINPLSDSLEIESMIVKKFSDLESIKYWLKEK